MPSELNRRALFAAAAAFLVALTVAYALSSTGQASPGTGAPGSPAQPLDDVTSGIAGQSTLGEAEALPALVHKPKPKPAKKAPAPDTTAPATPVRSNPAPPAYHPPVPQAPPSTPAPPAPQPEVFSDSG
jgi:hypothetical protein